MDEHNIDIGIPCQKGRPRVEKGLRVAVSGERRSILVEAIGVT